MNSYGIKQVISRLQLQSEAVTVRMILNTYPCEHVHIRHIQNLEAYGGWGGVDREDVLNKF